MDKYIVNMYCGGREIGVGDPITIKAGEVRIRQAGVPLNGGETISSV